MEFAFLPVADGSSPHTRGAHWCSAWDGPRIRIIPAYAGSTAVSAIAFTFISDHPRIRGEHVHDSSYTDRRGGSSPHTRGALRPVPERENWAGIIPAYAGSTPDGDDLRGAAEDHPRIRGEHAGAARTGDVLTGSSPHTRGAPKNVFKAINQTRIIPAYAGSTNSCRQGRRS